MTLAARAHHCERCAELEEEVAYLKSELGLRRKPTEIDLIRRGFGLQNGDAELLHVLYSADGKLVTRNQALDATTSRPDYEDERTIKGVDVRVCRLRKVVGRAGILNVWGQGYRLAPEAIARVRSVLTTPAQPQGGV